MFSPTPASRPGPSRKKSRIRSDVRERYPGLFGFERSTQLHYSAMLGAMRHYESVGDDAALGVILVGLVRGRRPWMVDSQQDYFMMARLERFSEVLLTAFRWVTRNAVLSTDETRRLLKKMEQYQPHKEKRILIRDFLCRELEKGGRIADAYDVAQLKPSRRDVMGLLRKKQLLHAIERGPGDMYQSIDPFVWKKAGRNAKSLLSEAERDLREAIKLDVADTTSRMHLLELLIASGNESSALEISVVNHTSDASPVMDFDAHAQRLVMLLSAIEHTKGQGVPSPGTLDEILQCCSNMLFIDPSSVQTVNVLVSMHRKGYFRAQHAGRLADLLASVVDSLMGEDGRNEIQTLINEISDRL
jgi:hypothetical protein